MEAIEKPGNNMSNLVGSDSTSIIDSKYRTSGGESNINTSYAEIKSIMGQTIVWNQLAGDQFTNWNGNTKVTNQGDGVWRVTNITSDPIKGDNSLANLVVAQQFPAYTNHVYYFSGEFRAPFAPAQFGFEINNKTTGLDAIYPTANTWQRISGITKCTWDYKNYGVLIKFVNSSDNNYTGIPAGSYYEFRNIMCIDLTAIYGFTNEPTTVAKFEADYQKWFGKSISEYETLDKGSIRTTLDGGIKTVGFNIWQQEDYIGTIRNWIKLYNNDYTIWKNTCGYSGQMELSVTFGSQSTAEAALLRFIYTDGTSVTGRADKGQKATQISDANKIVDHVRVTFSASDGSLDNMIDMQNLCLHFCWSKTRNGDYEEHWEKTQHLPITTLTGKLNGEGDSVVVFPNGMYGIGNFKDEIVVEGNKLIAKKWIIRMDIATINKIGGGVWSSTSNTIYRGVRDGKYSGHKAEGISNIGYITNKLYDNGLPKGNLTLRNTSAENKLCLVIYLPDGEEQATSANFTTLWNKYFPSNFEYIYIPLDEPEVYVLDNNTTLPITYKVDDFGTEETIAVANSLGAILTVDYNTDNIYKINLGDKVYDIADSSAREHISTSTIHITQTEREAWNAKAKQGEQGFQGYQGVQGTKGTDGSNGTSATHSWNGTTLTVTSASGSSSANLKGEQGYQGNGGPQGHQGTQGTQGKAGTNGTNGQQGNQGTQGTQGKPGTNGTNGQQGNQGTQGTQGKAGTNGTNGQQGNQGTQGTQGKAGTNGTNGQQGNQGTQGTQGKAGTNGTNGQQGNQGTQGTQGAKGTDGVSPMAPTISATATVSNTTGTPTVSVTKSGTTTAPSFAFAFSNLKGAQGTQGTQGAKGTDGVSPMAPTISATATVSDTTGTPAVSVTKSGTTTAPSFAFAFSNLKGAQGNQGAMGLSPVTPFINATATVSNTTGTPAVTVTRSGLDASPSFAFAFSNLKGAQGTQGTQGVQGKAGTNGTSATHSWNGTTLTVTSSSGSSSTNLKGEQGYQGNGGPQGNQGTQGTQGRQGFQGYQGVQGKAGTNGTSTTHSWNGTTLTVTSSSGSSSTNLKGEQGYQGAQGRQGSIGTFSGTIAQNSSSQYRQGINVAAIKMTTTCDNYTPFINMKSDKGNWTIANYPQSAGLVLAYMDHNDADNGSNNPAGLFTFFGNGRFKATAFIRADETSNIMLGNGSTLAQSTFKKAETGSIQTSIISATASIPVANNDYFVVSNITTNTTLNFGTIPLSWGSCHIIIGNTSGITRTITLPSTNCIKCDGVSSISILNGKYVEINVIYGSGQAYTRTIV